MTDEKPIDQPKPKSALKDHFDRYVKFGNPTKTTMTTANCNKMFREANISKGAGSKYTSADVDIAFSKVKQHNKKEINFSEFKSLLDELGKKSGGFTKDELITKLSQGPKPEASGTTKVVNSAVVEHLTDTSRYTGSHRERFDQSGKGKGLAGRHDLPDSSGYVTGYKDKNTYDSKVAK